MNCLIAVIESRQYFEYEMSKLFVMIMTSVRLQSDELNQDQQWKT